MSALGQGVQYTTGASGLTTFTWNGQDMRAANNAITYFGATFENDTRATPNICSNTAITDGFRHECNTAGPFHYKFDTTFSGAGTNTLHANVCIQNSDSLNRPMTLTGIERLFSVNITGGVYSEDALDWLGNPESVAKFMTFASYAVAVYTSSWGDIGFTWSMTNGKIAAHIPLDYSYRLTTILAGEEKCATVSVAFGSTSETIKTLAAPGYLAYQAAFPQQLYWADRRPIAMMFAANQQSRSATNPRGFPGGISADYLGAGFSAARSTFLNTFNLFLNNADTIAPKPQAACWWDWGGNEFEHVFTYVGYPGSDSGSHLVSLAPELEVKTNGVPLIDEAFNIVRARGYEPCITLRPQRVWQSGAGRPTGVCYAQSAGDGQSYIDTSATYPNRGYRCQERSVTFNDASDLVSCATCTLLNNGNVVRLYALTGTLPTALSSSIDYYIQNFISSTSFQISTDPGGSNIVTDFSGGSGTYQAESWRGPVPADTQELPHSYDDALDSLTQAIRYVWKRWGIKIIYIDTTLHKTDGQVGRSTITIGTYMWRQLMNLFPHMLLMPENSPPGPSHSKFLSTGNNQFYTYPEGVSARLYPEVFQSVHLNGNYHNQPGNQSVVRQGMQNGDIYMLSVNTISLNETQGKIDLVLALDGLKTISMADRGQPRTFKSDPGTSFTYPVTARVYFASTSGDLTDSTTYCTRRATDSCYLAGELQPTAALDLSALPYYQIRYYDFAGNLVSNPGTYGIIQ